MPVGMGEGRSDAGDGFATGSHVSDFPVRTRLSAARLDRTTTVSHRVPFGTLATPCGGGAWEMREARPVLAVVVCLFVWWIRGKDWKTMKQNELERGRENFFGGRANLKTCARIGNRVGAMSRGKCDPCMCAVDVALRRVLCNQRQNVGTPRSFLAGFTTPNLLFTLDDAVILPFSREQIQKKSTSLIQGI